MTTAKDIERESSEGLHKPDLALAQSPFTILESILPKQPRTENSTPIAYRLVSRSGTLTLQGLFQWTEGWTKSGGEWRDIPTVELEEGFQ